MPLDSITDPQAVRAAINEFQQLGQSAFQAKYGFGKSRGWVLVDADGKEYDAKAILGAAHAFQHPSQGHLPQSQFYGGAPTALKLRAMGFTVNEPPKTRNPPWNRDELILALELYMRHRSALPGGTHKDVVALSKLLNALAGSTNEYAKFRNGNGVAMKLQNFRRFDPTSEARGLAAGGRAEEDVWNLYANDVPKLRATAAAIAAATAFLADTLVDVMEDGEEAEEGQILTRLHYFRERNRAIVKAKKCKALLEHGKLACEACTFNFSAIYGQRGNDFIECHHTKAVSQIKVGDKTKLSDLSLLCANCHRMIHVRRPWMTVQELRDLIQERSKSTDE